MGMTCQGSMCRRQKIAVFAVFFFGLVFLSNGESAVTVHPVKIYKGGCDLLDNYQGDPQDLAQARMIFQRLSERFPKSPLGFLGLSRIAILDAYLHGNKYNMKLIHDQALPYATRALELGPTIPAVHDNYNQIEEIFANYYLDKKQAQIQLALSPEDPETFFVIGSFFVQQDEIDKAVEYFDTALEMGPGVELRIKLLKRLSWIHLYKKEDATRALFYCRQGLELAADDPAFLEYTGLAYMRLRQFQNAIKNLDRVVRQNANSLLAYQLVFARAALAEEQGQPFEALQLYLQAAQLRKGDSHLEFKLGDLYYQLGDYEQAYDHFRKVMRMAPELASAYYFAGRSAFSLGKPDLAVNHLTKYLSLDEAGARIEWIRQNMPELTQK